MSSAASGSGAPGGARRAVPEASGKRAVGRGTDALVLAGLLALALVTRLAFLYRGGAGDADVMVMAAGMARSLAPDVPFTDAFLYGRQIGPGIYLLFRLVFPALWSEPHQVLPFLNAVGVMSGALLAWPLYAVMRWRWPPALAAAGTIVVLFAPLVWEASTYFHPVVPATLLLGLALLSWRRIDGSARGVAFAGLTFVLGTDALLLRAEIALAAPALLAAALLSRRPGRNLALLIAMGVAGAGIYLAVVRALAAQTEGTPTGLWDYARNFADAYFRVGVVPKSLVWSMLAMGVGTAAAVGIGLLLRAVGRGAPRAADGQGAAGAYGAAGAHGAGGHPGAGGADPTVAAGGQGAGSDRGIWVALIWFAVPLLFWLSNPVPLMRHYFLAVPALGWIALWAFFPRGGGFRAGGSREGGFCGGRSRGAWVLMAAALLVAVNLAVPEILYGTYNRTHPDAPKAPHGSFFAHHRATGARLARYHDLVNGVRAIVVADPGGANPRGENSDPRGGRAGRVTVQAGWEAHGYLLYGLAGDLEGRPASDPVIELEPGYGSAGLMIRELRTTGGQVKLLLTAEPLPPSTRPAVELRLRDAAARRAVAFVARELAAQLALDPSEHMRIY